jgi:amidase
MNATADLSRRSAVELRNLIRDREVSASEVLEAHLAAIARHNPKFNAVVTLVADEARAVAAAADAAIASGEPVGPLHGLPVAIKDITARLFTRTSSRGRTRRWSPGFSARVR